jgi:four helix bundle protein
VHVHGDAICLKPRRHRDQLERASLSTVLNLAEGAGRVAPLDKARLYAIARGSAAECGAIVDVLHARRLVSDEDARGARERVVRIVQMLTGLLKRFRGSLDGVIDR